MSNNPQFEDCALTTVEDRGAKREYTVKSKHVVACDGAKSAVRRVLGIESEGQDSCKYLIRRRLVRQWDHGLRKAVTDETMMTIHLNADLRPVVRERVGMLHWVMDPEVSGFIIGYDLSGNQVLICNLDVSFLSCRWV